MRVWDIHPGYLSRMRLLGEHREIHAVWTVITEKKKGYAFHPETQRWRGHLGRLHMRHHLVVAEMTLRGYRHRSPLSKPPTEDSLEPLAYIDPPHAQFTILSEKYEPTERGRIPLPHRGYNFWAHHKYSVMARGYEKYKAVSKRSQKIGKPRIDQAEEMVDLVSNIVLGVPRIPALRNAWQHVVGYFKEELPAATRKEWQEMIPDQVDQLRSEVYQKAQESAIGYIEHSTLLADLSHMYSAE